MKRFRYMLCILGLSGLFSAYQFDAMAACNAAVAGQFCKMGSAYDCREGCYCLGGSRTNVGTNFRAACKNKKATLPSGAGIHYCPDEFPESQAGAKSEEDCYFWDCENVPNGTSCVGVQNKFKTLAPGKYFPVKKGTPASCTQSNIGPDDYCPGGSFKPSSAEKVGIFTCSTGTVRTSDLKNCTKTCPSGQYLKVTWQNRRWVRACTVCPAGYKCPGNEPWIVAGEGDVTEDKGKIQCTGSTYASGEGNAVCAMCSSTGPNGQMMAVAVQHDANGLNIGCGPVNVSNNNNSSNASAITGVACVGEKIRCPAKKYLRANGTNSSHCEVCSAGYYCPGGCFNPGNSQPQGRFECGPGKYSGANQAQCTNCTGRQYSTGSHNSTYQLCNINNGNSFVGPNHDDCDECPAGTQVSENFESCEAEVYTVTYNCGAHGTGNRPSDTVRYNDPFDPGQGTGCTAVGNYSFDKWTGASDGQTYNGVWLWPHSETLVAQWVEGPAPKYTVKFDCGDGTGNPVPGSVLAANGDSINTPNNNACTWAGHTYTQWKSGNLILPAGGSHTWWGSADDVMKPDWSQNTNCSVTYMCNGTSVGTFTYNTSSFNVEEGCDDLPDGRTFKWWGDSNGTHTLASGYYSCNGASAVTLTAEYNDAQVNPGSGGSDPTTMTCYDGYYLASGANVTSCTECPAGYKCVGDTFTLDGNEHGRTICPKGTYSHARASECTPCETGYYSDAQGASDCTYCNGIVDANNESCNPCNTDETVNEDHSACGPVTPPNSGQVQCQQGYYLPARSTLASQCTICPKGSMCPSVGNYEKNYSDDQGRIGCVGNTYSDYTGALECTECSGTVSDDHKSCNTGNGGGNGGNTTVTTCQSGQYVPLGGTSCTNCPSGSFCPTAGTAVAGKSYSCFMGTPNSSRTTCRMVLDKDNLLYGLGNGDNCWQKPLVAGPDGYKHCMFEGIRQVQ